MNPTRDPRQIIERITPFDLRAYLEAAGWQPMSSDSAKWRIFRLENPAGERVELVVPLDSNTSDYRERVQQTIAALSQIEDRAQAVVGGDVIGLSSDSIYFRLHSAGATIPAEYAPRHVKAIRSLVLFSALAETTGAQPFYDVNPSNPAELLQPFEFCHTFSGSFGFEISTAIAKPKQTTDMFTAPTARRVVERIARGMVLLERAVAEDEPDVLVQAYETAFSARMCDAVADIGIQGAVAFDLGIQWASSLAPADDVKDFKQEVIGESQTSMLIHVSEKLKTVQPQVDSLSGNVVNLHCVSDPTDDGSRRTIEIYVDHPVHRRIHVRMDLTPDRYLIAVEAHTKGLLVAARGQLQRKGSNWTMEALTGFEIAGGKAKS